MTATAARGRADTVKHPVRHRGGVGFARRIDRGGERMLRRARILIWNSILGILIFLLANWLFELEMPVIGWPLLLAVVFGVPGALAGIILWALVT